MLKIPDNAVSLELEALRSTEAFRARMNAAIRALPRSQPTLAHNSESSRPVWKRKPAASAMAKAEVVTAHEWFRSRRNLAIAAGVSMPLVSCWLAGKSPVSARHAALIREGMAGERPDPVKNGVCAGRPKSETYMPVRLVVAAIDELGGVRALARAIGISPSVVSRWALGQKPVSERGANEIGRARFREAFRRQGHEVLTYNEAVERGLLGDS